MAETTLAIDIPSICPRCASSYLKPSGKDIICGHLTRRRNDKKEKNNERS